MKKRKLTVMAISAVAILSVFTVPARAEGHFYSSDTGYVAAFYLAGGQYNLYVNASLGFSALRRSCVFAGNFSRLSPSQDTMHLGPAEVSTPIAYRINRDITLPAGLYRLYVASNTDCRWKFGIVSTAENSAGITPVQIVKIGNPQLVASVSLNDQVEFSADFRTEKDAVETVSGTMQILHEGKIVSTFPLQFGDVPSSRGLRFFQYLRWDPDDAKYLGTNTVKFVVKIGPREFTSTGEFTLTQ